MQIKIIDGLKQLLTGLKSTTPDIDVSTALTKFCKSYGKDVVVERHGRNAASSKDKRKFLIFFESADEAVQFAYDVSCETHGHEGVIVEVI